MARQMKVLSYVHGIPNTAVCDQCGSNFRIDPEMFKKPEEARKAMQDEFDKHTCTKQDFSQAAARIVREATKD